MTHPRESRVTLGGGLFALSLLAAFMPAPFRTPAATAHTATATRPAGTRLVDRGAAETAVTTGVPRQETRMGMPGGPFDASRGASTCSGFAADPAWGFASYGGDIGAGNIRIAAIDGHQEIFLTVNSGSHWIALQYDALRNDYEQVFVSPPYGTYAGGGIAAIDLGDIDPSPGDEVVVATSTGSVFLYSAETKGFLRTFPAASFVTSIALANVDGDAATEIVVCNFNELYVYSSGGILEWSVSGVGGLEMAVAQMDDDGALEIAFTHGMVLDTASHSVQWTMPFTSSYLAVADFDADGRSEIVASGGYWIRTYDVDTGSTKWEMEYGSHTGIFVASLNGDGVPDLLVGNASYGSVKAFDLATFAQLGMFDITESGVTGFAVGDVDGDGSTDVIWGAGTASSGPDHLYVADWQSKLVEWQSPYNDSPFTGPQIGDLDGDGRQELVVITEAWRYAVGGRLLVFDARTRELRASIDAIGNAIALRDVDGDGGKEILVGGVETYDGVIRMYRFLAGNTLSLVWSLPMSFIGESFYSVDAADIDGDGSLEIVAGTGPEFSGVAGTWVRVFDFPTGASEWQSAWLGDYVISGLEIVDTDGDGSLEIVALHSGVELLVFDGKTKALEARIEGTYRGLAIRKTDVPPTIIAGNEEGEIVTFAHSMLSNPPYVETSRITVSSERVEGITLDAQGRVWFGHGGQLTLLSISGECLWTSPAVIENEFNFSSFGRQTAFLPGSRWFYSAGISTVQGFKSGSGYGGHSAGVYVPDTGAWFLRNQNGPGSADLVFTFGPGGTGFAPLNGDWNGDGIETPGLYAPASGVFFLKNTSGPGAADAAFGFGPAAGWIPLVGDWNGDGVDTVGLYSPANGAFFLRNGNSPGPAEVAFGYGPAGVGLRPVVGDWDGSGSDTIGLYNPMTGAFFLKNANSVGPADLVFSYGPGGLGWKVLTGDWDGDGDDSIGLVDPVSSTFFLRNENSGGPADATFGYGPPGVTPLSGDWDGE